MNTIQERKAEEARQRFKDSLTATFPSIVRVLVVHHGPNRAQRRRLQRLARAKPKRK